MANGVFLASAVGAAFPREEKGTDPTLMSLFLQLKNTIVMAHNITIANVSALGASLQKLASKVCSVVKNIFVTSYGFVQTKATAVLDAISRKVGARVYDPIIRSLEEKLKGNKSDFEKGCAFVEGPRIIEGSDDSSNNGKPRTWFGL